MSSKLVPWLLICTLAGLTATSHAEPVRVTLEGACPAADLAERTARELELEGFEPAVGDEAAPELEIHHLCAGGYVILIRDPERNSVLREQMDDAPLEEVVIHAVELLRAVTSGREPQAPAEPEASAPACNAKTTIELGPPPKPDPDLADWESGYAVSRSPKCERKCWEKGQCKRVDGTCLASGDADCLQSKGCREEGRCREVAGQCLATQDRDCRRAQICREKNRCTADVEDHKCVDERPRRNRGVLAGSIVGISVSGVALIAGIAYLAASGASLENNEAPILPGILLLAGVAAPGIPLSIAGMVYGASRVSDGDADYAPKTSKVPPPATISVGPGGVSVAFRF